jgi:hypothetical protein
MGKYLIRNSLRDATRLRRSAAGVTAILSAVFLVGILFTPPVLAADEPNPLPDIGGHRCETVTPEDFTQNMVLCADLALYTSRSGQQIITLQVQAICQNNGGGYVVCVNASVFGSVANGGGYFDDTSMSCDVSFGEACKAGRNYFYPLGGIPISLGKCAPNVWGVIDEGSGGNLPDGTFGSSFNSFATQHYNVCEDSPGVLTYHIVS